MSQKPAKNSGRKKQLNVVYFVDSARTRSFRIPLSRLNLLLFMVGFLLFWSFASIGAIAWLVHDRQIVSNRLKDTLAVVFDYESRYEAVYEKAYPADGRLANVDIASVDVITDDADDPDNVQEDDEQLRQLDAKTAISSNTQQVESSTTATEPTTVAQEKTEIAIEVADPVVEQGANEIELKFKIKNQNSPSRIEGFIWAIAEFKPNDGKSVYIGSPSTIDVSGQGEAKYRERAHRFSIRHYKRKQFTFPLPKGAEGTFTGIKIGVMYKAGGDAMVYDVPVNIEIGKSPTETGSKDENKSGQIGATSADEKVVAN